MNVPGSATWLPNGLARMAFLSSVINLVYSYEANQTRFECSLVFQWSYQRGLFFRSLSPSLRRFCENQHISAIERTVNGTSWSWSNPRLTRICYIFRLWVIIKALLKQISLYLLSHFRIRIIVLTCPDNKSARNHQPKSCVPAKSRKSQWCEANIISIEIFPPFQFVPVRVKTREYHHQIFIKTSPLQRISTVQKPSIETLFEMEGQHGRFMGVVVFKVTFFGSEIPLSPYSMYVNNNV